MWPFYICLEYVFTNFGYFYWHFCSLTFSLFHFVFILHLFFIVVSVPCITFCFSFWQFLRLFSLIFNLHFGWFVSLFDLWHIVLCNFGAFVSFCGTFASSHYLITASLCSFFFFVFTFVSLRSFRMSLWLSLFCLEHFVSHLDAFISLCGHSRTQFFTVFILSFFFQSSHQFWVTLRSFFIFSCSSLFLVERFLIFTVLSLFAYIKSLLIFKYTVCRLRVCLSMIRSGYFICTHKWICFAGRQITPTQQCKLN